MSWSTQPLGSLVRDGELSYGIVQPGRDVSGGVPIVRVKDLRAGRINTTEPLSVDPAVSRKHSRTVLQGGELLVSIVGTVGEAAVVPESLAGWNVARAIAVVRPVGVTSNWIRLCLQTAAVRDHFHSMLNTTVQSTLNLADLRRLEIPVPPERVRRGVEEVLGALDDKITVNSDLARATDDLVGAMYAQATAHSPLGELRDIAEVNATSVKPPAQGSLRYLDIASIGVGSYELPEPIDWINAPGRARRRLQRGDTVWSTVRPNRRSHALVLDEPDDLIASTGLAVITPMAGRFAFVYEATRTPDFTNYLVGAAEGSAYPAVRGERFLSAPVRVLSADAAETFESAAAPLRLRSHSATAESRALAALRDGLLPKLMSGKLTVRDAESVVEEVI